MGHPAPLAALCRTTHSAPVVVRVKTRLAPVGASRHALELWTLSPAAGATGFNHL